VVHTGSRITAPQPIFPTWKTLKIWYADAATIKAAVPRVVGTNSFDRMTRLKPRSSLATLFYVSVKRRSPGSIGPKFDVCPDAGYHLLF
jgi:hypothetical protein